MDAEELKTFQVKVDSARDAKAIEIKLTLQPGPHPEKLAVALDIELKAARGPPAPDGSGKGNCPYRNLSSAAVGRLVALHALVNYSWTGSSRKSKRLCAVHDRSYRYSVGHRSRRPPGRRATSTAGLRGIRRLAAQSLAWEKPGQTLQATALVHDGEQRGASPPWERRGHFFAAAAEAMRRILPKAARRKGRQKRRGRFQRVDLDPAQLTVARPVEKLRHEEELRKRI